MERRKEVGRLDIENPTCKWHKTVYLEDGKLMKTIHDGSFTPVEPEPEMLPLYFDNLAINSHVGFVSTLETAPNFEWSWDLKEWHQWPYTTIDGVHRFDEKLLYSVGERLFIRGNNPNGLGAFVEGQEMPNFTSFVIDGSVSAGGNIMSLLDKTMELTEVPDYGFIALFAIKGEDVEPVLLTPPSMDSITAIGDFGCNSMFYLCSLLTSAAEMPALNDIGEAGCSGMYEGCTSLTTAADMPSLTTIGDYGCDSMYYECIFDMSDDGETLNFAFPTPPVTAGETAFATAYDVAEWMGNTNGFGGDNQ